MGHYDRREVKLRCDEPHDWGEPYLSKSSTSVELKDGRLCLKIEWLIVRACQNNHTNNVKSVYNDCQKKKTEDRGTKYVPVDKLPER